jgi:hydroxymethylpyrimidine pyrophosphatase-like HAD family hydrolase
MAFIMPLTPTHHLVLEQFVNQADIAAGAVILDLDGTALLEDQGKVFISASVEKAVQQVTATGWPVIINTLRFPLSVIRTIAHEWMGISTPRIPAILLNGSLIGHFEKRGDDVVFEELVSFPLLPEHVHGVVRGIQELIENNIHDIILFFYPRNWQEGEIIWTPVEERVPVLQKKYRSASHVVSWSLRELYRRLQKVEPCMALILVDRPGDALMAYQHSQPSTFHTRPGVDKAFGTKELAALLKISLADSLGAGDTLMDSFLKEVGLAAIVGRDTLPYRGIRETVVVSDPRELGELIGSFARLVAQRSASA